jgi:hypothetical protein
LKYQKNTQLGYFTAALSGCKAENALNYWVSKKNLYMAKLSSAHSNRHTELQSGRLDVKMAVGDHRQVIALATKPEPTSPELSL